MPARRACAKQQQILHACSKSELKAWLKGMETMAKASDPQPIFNYIRAKLRLSQERPSGSTVFTREVMAGAPRDAEQLAKIVLPRCVPTSAEGQINRLRFLSALDESNALPFSVVQTFLNNPTPQTALHGQQNAKR